MAVYSTFQFCLLLRAGKETNTVYSTQLISPETTFLSILFPTITKLTHGCIVLLTWKHYSDDNEHI